MDFSTHYFDFHGKSWMAHGRAWPHGSSSMILNHDSSMMSHVENFVQSRKLSLTVSVFVSSSVSCFWASESEGYLNGPGSIKDAFRHRVSWSREIVKTFVSIRWVLMVLGMVFDGIAEKRVFSDQFSRKCGIILVCILINASTDSDLNSAIIWSNTYESYCSFVNSMSFFREILLQNASFQINFREKIELF